MQQHEKLDKQIEKVISRGSKVITCVPGWKHFLIWTINFSIVLRLVFALSPVLFVKREAKISWEHLCLFWVQEEDGAVSLNQEDDVSH